MDYQSEFKPPCRKCPLRSEFEAEAANGVSGVNLTAMEAIDLLDNIQDIDQSTINELLDALAMQTGYDHLILGLSTKEKLRAIAELTSKAIDDRLQEDTGDVCAEGGPIRARVATNCGPVVIGLCGRQIAEHSSCPARTEKDAHVLPVSITYEN